MRAQQFPQCAPERLPEDRLWAGFCRKLCYGGFRTKLVKVIWLGAFLATLGLCLLSGEDGLTISYGDSWVFVCAVIFAVHVLWIERCVEGAHPLKLAILQNGVAAFLSAVGSACFEGFLSAAVLTIWPELLFAGGLSGAFAYTVQTYAQRYTPAANAAIICSLESVFAAGF